MRPLRIVLAAVFFAGASVAGSPASITMGPYVAAVGESGFTVCWETSKKEPTRLKWGATPECENSFTSDVSVVRHEVPISGLRPGQVAWYRLEGEGRLWEATPVRTAGGERANTRIAVFGDTHSTDGVHTELVSDILKDDPDLVLHTGDLALRPLEGGAGEFFRVEGRLLRSVPLLPAFGNHDGGGSQFVELFVRPNGGGVEPYYAVRRGPIAVLALDYQQSVEADSPQGRWIARTLDAWAADPGIVFRFVILHWRPFDSGSGHGSNLKVREALVPLFERYGVDVVFSGHDHIFERSTVHGVRYVVTGGGGGGGGKYGRKRHVPMGASFTEVSAAVPHHCLLEIAGRTLRFTAREAGTGRLLDEFSLEKDLK